MPEEVITKELLCVLTEIGFDKAYIKKNPHEIIKAHAAAQVRDYLRMVLLKLPATEPERAKPKFEDLADVLALVKRQKK